MKYRDVLAQNMHETSGKPLNEVYRLVRQMERYLDVKGKKHRFDEEIPAARAERLLAEMRTETEEEKKALQDMWAEGRRLAESQLSEGLCFFCGKRECDCVDLLAQKIAQEGKTPALVVDTRLGGAVGVVALEELSEEQKKQIVGELNEEETKQVIASLRKASTKKRRKRKSRKRS